jgi:hypothetical protein
MEEAMVPAPVYLALNIDRALDALTAHGLGSLTRQVDIRPALFDYVRCRR